MNEKKQPTEYPKEQPVSTYQTGFTTPPKSHVGFLAAVLSLVIVICGVSALLSLMRINLMQLLLQQTESQKCTMAFSETEAVPARLSHASLRFQGEPLDDFWQNYRDLPRGIYVTDPGQLQPLEAGDVLVSIEGTQVTDWESVDALICRYAPGQQIPVTIYRGGEYAFLKLTIYE